MEIPATDSPKADVDPGAVAKLREFKASPMNVIDEDPAFPAIVRANVYRRGAAVNQDSLIDYDSAIGVISNDIDGMMTAVAQVDAGQVLCGRASYGVH